MGWFIAYLCCAFIIPTIIGELLVANEEAGELDFKNTGDVMCCAMACLLWPATLIGVSYTYGSKFYKKRKRAHKEHLANLVESLRSNRSVDRSELVSSDESKLKTILKAYRKEQVLIDTVIVEAIRDELLRRNMERNLLK
jgi:hypothetical protein